MFSIKRLKKRQLLLILLGCGLALWGMIVWSMSNFNLGYPVTVLTGLTIAIYGFFYNEINSIMPKWLKIIFATLIILFAGLLLFLFVYGQWDTATGEEDAVIVLGAGIRGEQVSYSLKRRLDVAVTYLEENPKAVVVVSGGQGPDEAIAEAEAMKRYLAAHNIEEKRIIKEDKSTSTAENFQYSKEILDGVLGENYSVAYVTNNFHAFRAGVIAEDAGLDASRQSAGLDLFLYPMTYLREGLACCFMFATRITAGIF